jgi:N-methylhydantoinase B/oxoprolinase/acetone carboxylase alpha subunit
MFGALRLGERRISQLLEKYGQGTWHGCLEEVKSVSERYMREEIRKIPSGSYEYEDYIDDDGRESKAARIRVRIDIKGDEVVADYTGSSPQVGGPVNAAFAVTAGNTVIGVLHSVEIGGDYIVNQGTFRPIKIVAPLGTIVNPNFPAPVQGGNTELSNRIVDTVIGALAQGASGTRIKAACHGTDSGITFGGIHPDSGEQYINYLWSLGGQGGRQAGDGNSAMEPFATNNKGPYIEVNEIRFPILHEEYSMVQDSAGPGKLRGGIGTRLAWRIRSKESLVSSLSDRHRISPYGVFGGLPPLPRECGHFSDTRLKINGDSFAHATEKFGKKSPSKWSNVLLHEGDVIELTLSGGGGWGNPLERAPEAVAEDVLDGFVSIEAAKNCYGVVVDPDSKKLNIEATRTLRDGLNIEGLTISTSDVRWIQTVQFERKKAKDDRSLKELLPKSTLAAFISPDTITLKLVGENSKVVAEEIRNLEKALGQSRVLTTQFVPMDF